MADDNLTYKSLAEAAKDMNEIMGLEPPIKTVGVKRVVLIDRIKAESAQVFSEDALQETTWAVFEELGVGPSKEAADKTTTAKGKDKKADDKKADKKKEIAAAADAKKKKKNPGVIKTLIKYIEDKGPVSKEQMLKHLAKKFPERDAKAMKNTVNIQVPNRINKERDFNLIKDAKGRWSVG